MPKVFIEMFKGIVVDVYASPGTEVFILNPEDSSKHEPLATESLDAVEVYEEPALLVLGNFSDGFTFVGPFDTFDEASNASYDYADFGSWIATLNPPKTEETSKLGFGKTRKG